MDEYTIKNTFVTSVLNYLSENINKKITVKDIAGSQNLHPNYFIKLFNQHFGVSPGKYINEIKVNKISSMLLETSLSVTDIASLTGFDDIFSLSRFFKQHTGLSPMNYRNLYGYKL